MHYSHELQLERGGTVERIAAGGGRLRRITPRGKSRRRCSVLIAILLLMLGGFVLTLIILHRSLGSGGITTRKVMTSAGEYGILERGQLYTANYRCYITRQGGVISPWHDIPLFANKQNRIYNMVVEIPRWTNAKMEIATRESSSPIRQDQKKGAPRFVDNVFPHKGYLWNYGALPQTWEDPAHHDPQTAAIGDNDPIDVIDVGDALHPRGSVIQVKILGVIALVDEGETDWKLVAIDANDPNASKINSIEDVDRLKPTLLQTTREWFRNYKIPQGKPANKFGYDANFLSADFAHNVIAETHSFWQRLIREPSPELNTDCLEANATHPASQDEWLRLAQQQGPPTESLAPAPVPNSLNRWHYLANASKL